LCLRCPKRFDDLRNEFDIDIPDHDLAGNWAGVGFKSRCPLLLMLHVSPTGTMRSNVGIATSIERQIGSLCFGLGGLVRASCVDGVADTSSRNLRCSAALARASDRETSFKLPNPICLCLLPSACRNIQDRRTVLSGPMVTCRHKLPPSECNPFGSVLNFSGFNR
jgi:hypothetical protein